MATAEPKPAAQAPVSSVEKLAADKPPTEVKPKGVPQKTINLKGIFQQPKKEEVKEQAKRTKPVALEDLQHAWAQFSETKKEEPSEHKILCYDFSLDGTAITLSLENAIEEPMFFLFKEELTMFLRNKLENDSLSIALQMTKGTDTKIAYTNREKFEEMARKNPFLLELQQKFQLDPDF